jgi:hypothetical protein
VFEIVAEQLVGGMVNDKLATQQADAAQPPGSVETTR